MSVREPRRLPVVLSPEEVGRLLASTTNIKQKAVLSLTYATGLRASEVISLKLTDIDRDRMVIRVEQGKGKKDRYVILSPNLLELLREWWRVARKKGWMHPGQPWFVSRLARAAHECAPAPPARSHGGGTRRHCQARQGFTPCGTALPPISWSRRPIFGSSRFYSKQRHTARQRPIEGRIYYPFHPRCGEPVLIARQYVYRGAELVVIPQPDGSVACIPAWMTHESAAQHQLRAEPRLSLDILRSLRAEIDVLLAFRRAERSGTYRANGDQTGDPTRNHSYPVRRAEVGMRLGGEPALED